MTEVERETEREKGGLANICATISTVYNICHISTIYVYSDYSLNSEFCLQVQVKIRLLLGFNLTGCCSCRD